MNWRRASPECIERVQIAFQFSAVVVADHAFFREEGVEVPLRHAGQCSRFAVAQNPFLAETGTAKSRASLGRYNPAANNWTATAITGAPAGCQFHKAVWTGSEMIVWGGYDGSSFMADTWCYTPGKTMFLYLKP